MIFCRAHVSHHTSLWCVRGALTHTGTRSGQSNLISSDDMLVMTQLTGVRRGGRQGEKRGAAETGKQRDSRDVRDNDRQTRMAEIRKRLIKASAKSEAITQHTMPLSFPLSWDRDEAVSCQQSRSVSSKTPASTGWSLNELQATLGVWGLFIQAGLCRPDNSSWENLQMLKLKPKEAQILCSCQHRERWDNNTLTTASC